MMHSRERGLWRLVLPAIGVALGLVVLAGAARAQTVLWGEQVGSDGTDMARAADADGAGGVLACGDTTGDLAGANAGVRDAWLARFDGTGAPLWMRQLGSRDLDSAQAIASDGAGGAFVGGITYGNLGGPNAGEVDAWVARYDSAGTRSWVRQIGTSEVDTLEGVVADGAGGLFVAGSTDGNLAGGVGPLTDAWLARLDGAGNVLWIRQLGSFYTDDARAVASDGAGGVFVVGETDDVMAPGGGGSGDPWLARYDAAGNPLWIVQTGSAAYDRAFGATEDGAGGLYVCGYTAGDFGGPLVGKQDPWVARYDGAGNAQWVRHLGSTEEDLPFDLALDPAGGVFVGGWTRGDLGSVSSGEMDAWLARLDGAGALLWIEQLGTDAGDDVHGLATRPTGGVFACGGTGGALYGPPLGMGDAWLARYAGDCASPTTYCTSKPSSLPGCTPALAFTGSPSASAGSGFEISAAPVPGQKPGLWVVSTHGAAATPVQNAYGWLCIATTGLFRCSPGASGGTPAACDGTLAFDFNAYLASPTKPPSLVAGATVDLQAWYRDPPSSGGANLTEAGHFTICP